jgi:hypothetical protein
VSSSPSAPPSSPPKSKRVYKPQQTTANGLATTWFMSLMQQVSASRLFSVSPQELFRRGGGGGGRRGPPQKH